MPDVFVTDIPFLITFGFRPRARRSPVGGSRVARLFYRSRRKAPSSFPSVQSLPCFAPVSGRARIDADRGVRVTCLRVGIVRAGQHVRDGEADLDDGDAVQ